MEKKSIGIVAQRWAMYLFVRYTKRQWERFGHQQIAWGHGHHITGALRIAEALLSSLLFSACDMEKLYPQLPINLMIQERVGETEWSERQEPITEAKGRQVEIFLPTMAETSRDLFPLSCFVWDGAGLAFPSQEVCCRNPACWSRKETGDRLV